MISIVVVKILVPESGGGAHLGVPILVWSLDITEYIESIHFSVFMPGKVTRKISQTLFCSLKPSKSIENHLKTVKTIKSSCSKTI
jgi:hypothetical protein